MFNARLRRRQILQTLGLGTGSLFLPSLLPRARGGGSPAGAPMRIVFLQTYHGLLYRSWSMRPGGAPQSGAWERDLGGLEPEEFSDILAPLHPVRDKMLVLDGLDLVTCKGMGGGIGHAVSPINSMSGAFTTTTDGDARATVPTIDQLIADEIGRPDRFRSFEVGIDDVPTSSATPGQALPRETRPNRFWNRLFPEGAEPEDGGPPSVASRLWARQDSVLDRVADEYAQFNTRLSVEDRQKLDLHLQMVRDLEQRVGGFATLDCSVPEQPVDPGSLSPDVYGVRYSQFVDLITVAFACDMTRVATVALTQMPNTEFGAPPGDVHQDFAHLADNAEPGSVAFEQMTNYGAHHAGHVLEFVQKLDAIPEANGTMLDNTLVVWLNEMATGDHDQDVYPMVLFGGSNVPMRFGKYIKYVVGGPSPLGSSGNNSQRPSGMPQNRVLTSIAQAMGLDVDVVGDAEVAADGGTIDCRGPAPGVLLG